MSFDPNAIIELREVRRRFRKGWEWRITEFVDDWPEQGQSGLRDRGFAPTIWGAVAAAKVTIRARSRNAEDE